MHREGGERAPPNLLQTIQRSDLAGGITWGVGLPPPLSGLGLGGFANELLGFLGAPTTWGAVVPDAALGPALVFHWIFQHLLLAAFAIVMAIRPRLALAPLRRTVEGAAEVPSPTMASSGS